MVVKRLSGLLFMSVEIESKCCRWLNVNEQMVKRKKMGGEHKRLNICHLWMGNHRQVNYINYVKGRKERGS